MTIRLRVAHVVTCWDGDAQDEWIPQISVNESRWTGVDSAASDSYIAASEVCTRSGAEFERRGYPARQLPSVTIKRHRHIGEYGSPKIHRCVTLDAY